MKLGARGRLDFSPAPLRAAVKKANITSYKAAGAYIRGFARRSIAISSHYSKPGKPPHSRYGLLKDAIIFQVEEKSVVIGPSANRVGDVARVHEFGGQRERPSVYRVRSAGGGRRTRREVIRKSPVFPPRPFMGPALERAKPRLPDCWANSVRS